MTILTLIGGIAYTPNNYDYLTYRFPRVLYWSWDQAWTWIPTINHRMNYSGTGFEWLMVPLFVLFKTDRLFFLINFIAYLFLPGLVFSVFSHLGISRRISWWWMWILPSGYCYILQAGSAGNDSIAVVYFLASLHYLFQAKGSSSFRNLALSSLAIALTTGIKASNLPLVLPWLLLVFFQRAHLLKTIRVTLLVPLFAVAALVSYLPIALLNIHFTGTYTGDPTNNGNLIVRNPVGGLLGNSLQMAKDNFAPPALPVPVDWQPLLPSPIKIFLARDFPRLDLHSGELQMEFQAGVGLGVVLFAALFAVWAIVAQFSDTSLLVRRNKPALWVTGAGVVAWLAFMTKMGSESTSRLIAAYYPLLIAGVLMLASLDGRIMRHRLFKGVGLLAMLSALLLVVLSPARPLFPVQLGAIMMANCHVPPGIIARYHVVYSIYAVRADALNELTAPIPSTEQAVGFLQTGDTSEVSLWRPFGTRHVVEVTPDNSVEQLQAKGVHFVIVSGDGLSSLYHMTVPLLAAEWSASIVAKKGVMLKAYGGPEPWYLLRL